MKRRSKSAYPEPEKFNALLHHGILKAQSGRFQEALDLLNAALKINPDRRKRT